jgi:hypothetical protein
MEDWAGRGASMVGNPVSMRCLPDMDMVRVAASRAMAIATRPAALARVLMVRNRGIIYMPMTVRCMAVPCSFRSWVVRVAVG